MLDPLKMFSRDGLQTDSLRDMLAGKPAFLVAGGPSTKSLDMSLIDRRGVFSLAVNNMAGHFRASAFVCSDPPSKFCDGIWLDPGMMKFVPLPKLTGGKIRSSLRTKRNGVFEDLSTPTGERMLVKHCPNVWGFGRRTWWAYDDTFFTDGEASWGNGNAGVIRTKNPKTFNTLLLGLRLLHYLGSRCVFLVGVDFNMAPGQGYSFSQNRDAGAISSNAHQYAVVNYGLCEMVANGVFRRAGMEIWNCNPNSGLRAFGHVPYDSAVKATLKDFPPEPFDLSGWYEKGAK